MKRFKPKSALGMKENRDGSYVLYTDALECMQAAIYFAIHHQDDVENDVGDFGELRPLLDMAKAIGVQH